MLLSAASVLVVAQSSSEIPEELMNNPVLSFIETSFSASIYVSLTCRIKIKFKTVHRGTFFLAFTSTFNL